MNTLKDSLKQKFSERTACIGIVGMGYVGLPLAVAFAEYGFEVVGIDISSSKVDNLNQGVSYIEDIASHVLLPLVEDGKLRGSTILSTTSSQIWWA